MLRDLTNVVVHLDPAPVVTRVPITLGRLRGREWEEEVVACARDVPRRSRRARRRAVSESSRPGRTSATASSSVSGITSTTIPSGSTLRRSADRSRGCMRRSPRIPKPLPRFERLDEIARVIAGLQPDDAAILREAHARLSAREPLEARELRPIHGEVHFRRTSSGRRKGRAGTTSRTPVSARSSTTWRESPGAMRKARPRRLPRTERTAPSGSSSSRPSFPFSSPRGRSTSPGGTPASGRLRTSGSTGYAGGS